MDAIEAIVDRRIREAREAGLFDDLPGAGKPIPDLDRRRPEGWWAARTLRTELEAVRAEGLDADLEQELRDNLHRRRRR